MTRVFFGLIVLALSLLAINVVFGLMTGDYNNKFWELGEVSMRKGSLERKQRSPDEDDELASLVQERQALFEQYEPLFDWVMIHVLVGVTAALVVLLVNCISITYFIGTSRWCKEVVETYGLDGRLVARGNALKRRTFVWALGAMLVMVAVISLGAASHPNIRMREGTEAWVLPHYIGALLGTGLIGWSFLVQLGNIRANHEVIEETLRKVATIRERTG